MSAGERAFFVAEEFTLQERFGNGAAIDRHERPVFAGAALMNRQGHHLLASAAFPQDQDRRFTGGDFADGSEDLLDLRTGTDHPFETIFREPMLHLAVFPLKLGNVEGPFEEDLQLLHLDRLAEQVVSTLADRPQSVLPFGLSCHDNDFSRAIHSEQFRNGGKTHLGIIRTRWQAEVEQSDNRTVLFEGLEGTRAVLGQSDFVVLRQGPLHLRADVFVVIDEEQFRF